MNHTFGYVLCCQSPALFLLAIALVLAVVVWVRMLRPKSRYGSRGRRNRGTRNYRGRRR